jgi:hypothetical protein
MNAPIVMRDGHGDPIPSTSLFDASSGQWFVRCAWVHPQFHISGSDRAEVEARMARCVSSLVRAGHGR